MSRRVLVSILVTGSLLITVVYLVYFQHPPTEEVIENNRKSRGHGRMVTYWKGKRPSTNQNVPREVKARQRREEAKWQKWLDENKLVSIGTYYTGCADDGVVMGQIVLMPDKKDGGLTAWNVLNTTWDKEIDDADMFLEVLYNGKRLYRNTFEFCTVDEDAVQCPLPRGAYHLNAHFKIASYIPKGRYQLHSYVTTLDKQVIACAYIDFRL